MLYKFEDMAELFNDELLGDEVTASTVGKAEQWLYAFGNR